MDKLGVFLSVSLYFVVATLIEFALVLLIKNYNEQNYSKRECQRNQSQKNRLKPTIHRSLDDFNIENWSKTVSSQNIMDLKKQKKRALLALSIPKIDTYASFIFISGYMFFNLIYWNL